MCFSFSLFCKVLASFLVYDAESPLLGLNKNKKIFAKICQNLMSSKYLHKTVSLFPMLMIIFVFFVINLRKSQFTRNFHKHFRSYRKFSQATFAKMRKRIFLVSTLPLTHEHPGGGFLAQVLEALAEVDEQNVVVPQQQIKISQRSHTVKK